MRIPGLLRGRVRRGPAVAVAVLAVGVVAGAGCAAGLAGAQRAAADTALQLRVEGARHAVATTVQRYVDAMHDLTAVAAQLPPADLDPTLTRLAGDLPGAHEVLVLHAEPGAPAPGGPGAGVRIGVARPLDGTVPAAQRDPDSEPELLATLQAASRSGRLTAGRPHVLAQDRSLPAPRQQQGLHLVAPLGDATGLRGWVVLSLRAGDLLAATMAAAGPNPVAVQLSQVDAAGDRQQLARWGTAGDGAEVGTGDVALAQQRWEVTVRPTAPLRPATAGYAAPAMFTAALVASLALAVAVLAMDRERERTAATASRLAAARSADTDRLRRAEAALREREAELAGFAAVATESLHTPLANIAGFTELLIDEAGPSLDAAANGFLERIADSSARMLALLDELLAYTAAGDAPLRLEPVDVGRLVTDLVLENTAGLAHRPHVDIGALPVVTADAELLRQVLDQLLGNAVRYVRHGSTARVTIGARQDANGWWRVEFADRGIGVPAEQRARIFAPFHRAPAAEGFPGSGLGLAICQRIVSLHGGQIGVDANPGGGSIFWFTVFDGRSDHQCGEHPHFYAHA